MRLKYFHLTPSNNTHKIKKEGIKADEEGNIFVFTDMLVANEIAKNQVFTEQYAVFKIERKGITGKIEKDNVAEFAAFYQRIIKQKTIKPKFVKFMSVEDTVFDKPTTWDYLVYARMHKWTYEQTDAYFSVQEWHHEHSQKKDIPEDELETEYRRLMKELGIDILDAKESEEYLKQLGLL
jgi:hypothetical protein